MDERDTILAEAGVRPDLLKQDEDEETHQEAGEVVDAVLREDKPVLSETTRALVEEVVPAYREKRQARELDAILERHGVRLPD